MSRPVALRLAALCVVLSFGLLAFAATHLDRAGPYYDEAFMGQQAKDFFEPERGLHHPASTREIVLFGRPFPLRNAVYLGALKSQALMPAFAVFGSTLRVMRVTTLVICLAALAVFVAFAARLLGPEAAAALAVLLALDPAFYFWGVYEWGPFSVLLLCRALGMALAVDAWLRPSPVRAALAGVALGLGIFARADFVVVVAAGVVATCLVRPSTLREAFTSHRAVLVGGVVGLALGAGPMLLTVRDLLTTSANPVIGGRGDLIEKLQVVGALLDGSRFLRVVSVGGRFHLAPGVDAPMSALGIAAGLAAAVSAVWLARSRARAPGSRVLAFLLVFFLLLMAGMLAIPGAVRAHHLLNGMPLPHLLVAGVFGLAWRRARVSGGGLLARGALLAALLFVVATQARLLLETRELIQRSGGRGRFSEAIRPVAAELEATPGARGVSLDWGFHEPLLFLTRKAELEEPIWQMRPGVRARGEWRRRGRPADVYLVHDGDYDLFGFGPAFLAAAGRLELRRPGLVEVRDHRDDEGGLVLKTVRIGAEHEVVFARGFRIEVEEARELQPELRSDEASQQGP